MYKRQGKSRTITPAPWVMQLLRTQRARQAEQQLKVGPLWEGSGMVFTNETGGYLSYRTVYDLSLIHIWPRGPEPSASGRMDGGKLGTQ